MSALRIVIFAKAPRAGRVKTRLVPALGADGAARLAERMLRHTVSQALLADLGMVELCGSPADDPYWNAFNDVAGLTCSDQGDGDLGARLARAARRVIDGGASILLTGTDCPALDASLLNSAATALHEADAVLVPALDGGYVALGLRRYHPEIFARMPWSTDAVAATTLSRIRQLGWSLIQLAAEQDIDEPADLDRLPSFLRRDPAEQH
jgi:rSAM/selenodomain-associated transferase 1